MFRTPSDIIDAFTSAEENRTTDYLRRENSNFVYSLPLLRYHLTQFAEEKYLFERVLPSELVELHRDGVVYIHDRQLSPRIA